MDERVPAHRDSQASSHRETSEPLTRVVSGKQSVDREPKLQGPLAEDVLVESYLVQKIFGDLITADHKIFSE